MKAPRRNTQIKQYLSLFLDRPLAVHRIFGKIAGGLSAGVMLSQAYYWCDKGSNPDWFWKTQAEWQEETLLSRREQETARRSLLLLRTADGVPVWEEQRRGQPARLYFRLNLEALSEVIETYLNGGIVHSSMAESANLEWLETPIKDGEKRQSIKHRIQTENTTENTNNGDFSFSDQTATATAQTGDPDLSQLVTQADLDRQMADEQALLEKAGLDGQVASRQDQDFTATTMLDGWMQIIGGAKPPAQKARQATQTPVQRNGRNNGMDTPTTPPQAQVGARKAPGNKAMVSGGR